MPGNGVSRLATTVLALMLAPLSPAALSQVEVAAVTNASYRNECGACHFAYQPGLLPSAAWQTLLTPAALADHFGDNAELEEGVRQAILAYLRQGAAETSNARHSRQVMASLLPGDIPLRITEVRYIRRKHARLSAALTTNNPKVGSLSHCQRCHTKAEAGGYDDRDVRIPGHGKWTW